MHFLTQESIRTVGGAKVNGKSGQQQGKNDFCVFQKTDSLAKCGILGKTQKKRPQIVKVHDFMEIDSMVFGWSKLVRKIVWMLLDTFHAILAIIMSKICDRTLQVSGPDSIVFPVKTILTGKTIEQLQSLNLLFFQSKWF